MPDDRFFHKRLGHSEKVTRLNDLEYIVWQAFILSADDFGVMRFSAITLQADHDRFAIRSTKSVQRALEKVREAGLIHTFTHQGRVYAFQSDWQRWQKVTYPRATVHPKPDAAALAGCEENTRLLFDLHPGGWGRRKPETSGNGSESVPETVLERLENVSPKPLALAVSLSQEPKPEKKEISSEPKSAHEPADNSPTMLVYPVVGLDGHEWRLTKRRVDDWSVLFPDVDVLGEARKALAWVGANPAKRKTGRGMPKFLAAWLSRAADRPSAAPAGFMGKTAQNMPSLQRFAAKGQ